MIYSNLYWASAAHIFFVDFENIHNHALGSIFVHWFGISKDSIRDNISYFDYRNFYHQQETWNSTAILKSNASASARFPARMNNAFIVSEL